MLDYKSIKDNLENAMALLSDVTEVTGTDIKEAYEFLSVIEIELEKDNSLHVDALKETFKQFDSYKSNCASCRKGTSCGDSSEYIVEYCEELDLICRDKLMEAAEELDNT